jgi:tetratricopeptide (TPR) repeat protein
MSNNQEAPLPTQHIPGRVFLNYAHEDRPLADRLCNRLMKAGLENVWLDHTAIEGGDRWKKEIDHGLRDATVLVALLTKHSIDPSRYWVEYEQLQAKRLFKPIIPLCFGVKPPGHLEHLQCIDITDDDDSPGLSKLLSTIRNLTSRSRIRELETPRPVVDAFVGREDELQALFDFVDVPGERVDTALNSIAIHGMGGQGKTMLAEELVRRIFRRYPGGLLQVRRGQSPPPVNEVLRKWARSALGREPDHEYDSDGVRRLLAGHGEMLVLIDDVNDLDFEATELLLGSLPADATRILTTRSENIAQELGCRVFHLSRLNDKDACELVRERLRSRMGTRAALDDPKLDAAIRRLVDLVEGHALVLEVTSARCNLPGELSGIVDHLANSLAEGLDNVDVRAHRVRKDNSVVASLKISLEQLRGYDEELPGRFTALGVFPDSGRMNLGLIAPAWADAGDVDRTINALTEIYRLAMIKLEPDYIYSFHPVLRWFAHNLLLKEPDLLAATQRRYREFLTHTATHGFNEPEDQWSRMEFYTSHLLHTAEELWDECTSVLGDLDALALPEPPAAGIILANPTAREAVLGAARFAQALMPYVLRRPAIGDSGRRLLTLGLACVRAIGAEESLDTFVRALGVWYARSDTHLAERYFKQALQWAEHTGDRAELGKVLSAYGELERNRTRFAEALLLLKRALAIHQEVGDQRMQAVTLKSSGEAYARQCDFDTAMDHYDRAIELYKTLGDQSGEADLYNKVGSVEFNRGNYQEAISQFEKALPMHQKLENRSMEGEDWNDMGISYTYLKQPEQALPKLKTAIEIHSQLGNRRLEAIAISNLAGTHYMLGRQNREDYERAVLEARKAITIAQEIEDKLTEVWGLNWEALAQQELGKPDLALPLLEQAAALLGQTAPRERVSTWGNLGYLLGKDLGQPERGAALLEKAIKLMRELMREQVFTRAWGGRSLAELEAQLREVSA